MTHYHTVHHKGNSHHYGHWAWQTIGLARSSRALSQRHNPGWTVEIEACEQPTCLVSEVKERPLTLTNRAATGT